MSRAQIGALLALVCIAIAACVWAEFAANMVKRARRRGREIDGCDGFAIVVFGGLLALFVASVLFGIASLVKFVLVGW